MSGRHEFFAGVTDTRYERGDLRDDIKILPQYFKDAGYRTAMIGKWHLATKGEEVGLTGKPLVPHQRGFDMALYTFNKWIDSGNDEQPYFVYLATSIPHGPVAAPAEYLALYQDSGLTKKQAGYYAMVSNVDTNMGRLMKWLEKRQGKRETILIFMTDNGHAISGAAGAGHGIDGFLEPDGLYNAGLRGGKNQQWQGGTCVPFFLYWPGVADTARDCTTLGSGMDMLSTFCDIIGVKPDDPGLQGYSLLNDILGKPTSVPKDRILVHHCGRWTYPTELESFKYNASVITDRYRLVWEKKGKSNKDAERSLALYDYRSDRGEKQNVIDQHPEVAKRLQEAFEPWWLPVRPRRETKRDRPTPRSCETPSGSVRALVGRG
jgi:arylsulfatase